MGGGASGLAAHCPPSRYLGGGAQRAAVKPDVRWASLAEQVGPGQGHLCWADACSCSPTTWGDFSELGMAAWRQRRCCGEAASHFGDGFGEVSQGGDSSGGLGSLGMRRDSKVPGSHAGPCHVPLPYAGTGGVGHLGLILNLGQNTVQFVLPPAGRQGEARQ